jgi:stage II sporulation protein D
MLLTAGCETVDGIKRDIGIDEPHGDVRFAREPEIRARVLRDQTQVRINNPGMLVIKPIQNASADLVRGPISIAGSSRGFVVTDGLGRKKNFLAGQDLEVLPSTGSVPVAGGPGQATTSVPASNLVIVNGQSFPGHVELRGRWNQSGFFDVIAEMPVESYLPGVLERELYPAWPRQVFELQAVASRTYALHEREQARRAGRPFDVEVTQDDQVYGGQARAPRPIEAARSTRGQVLTYNGTLIRAYFSSQCGGRPASARWAWHGDGMPVFNQVRPLQGKKRPFACQQSPDYRWTVTRSEDDVTRRLRAYGRATGKPLGDVQRVREIVATERNEADRPTRYTITDTTGSTFEVAPEELRVGLNYGAPDLPPIPPEARVRSGDLLVSVFSTQVRIQGRGKGHAVGLCQFCARGMAEQGSDWPSMVKDFYPGARVEKAY